MSQGVSSPVPPGTQRDSFPFYFFRTAEIRVRVGIRGRVDEGGGEGREELRRKNAITEVQEM